MTGVRAATPGVASGAVAGPEAGAPRTVQLVVSIDVEEDNWLPSREDVRCENARALPAHHGFLRSLGLRPTYFVNHAVATDPDGRGVLAELAGESDAEIGAHLHPWNTPPLRESWLPRHTMLHNLDAALQREKLEVVRDALERATGRPPRVFRAGRFGLGRSTVRPLLEAGFEVDSSVTPDVSWESTDEGPAFWGAPRDPYRIAGDEDPARPVRGGALWEVPLSTGFTRAPFAWRARWLRRLGGAGSVGERVAWLGSALRVLRPVLGAIEIASVEDLLAMCHHLVASGAQVIHVFWHSPSLIPGCTPFTRSAAEVEAMHDDIRRFVEGVSRMATVAPATVGEVAARAAREVGEPIRVGAS